MAGISDWMHATSFVSAGFHTFTWTYRKDAAGSSGQDAAWIDLVQFYDNAPGTDPTDPDSDGDGMWDGWEAAHNGFDPLAAQTDGTHGAGDDPDGDCLTNGEESALSTDPFDGDTDGDGLNDLLEIKGAAADQWPEYRWPVSDPRIPLQNTVTVPAPQGRAQVEMRSAAFDGTARIVLPALAKYAMTAWTLGAWVNPSAFNGRHVVVRRAVAEEGH